MDLQKKRDELDAKIQADTKEIHRLMEVTKQNIKKVKDLDKLIKHATDLGLVEIESKQDVQTNSAHSFTEGSDL